MYYIASVVPVWNSFLLVALACTGGLGVLCDGQWTSKEETGLPGSDLERRWHAKEVWEGQMHVQFCKSLV